MLFDEGGLSGIVQNIGGDMKCPKCTVPLIRKGIDDIVLDECPQCRGIWFDPGELDALRDEIEPDLRWMNFDIWKKEGDFTVSDLPLGCPKCARPLRVTRYETGDVRIRYCPSCRGIWLEHGDFLKIILALSREADEKNTADYIRASLKEASDLVTRPDRLISEWRDLKAVMRLLMYRFFVENPKVKNILVGIQKSLPL